MEKTEDSKDTKTESKTKPETLKVQGAEAAEIGKELAIKHPLQNKWVLWFFKNDKNKDWALNLKRIIDFDTVESFWSLYNYTQVASKLQSGCDYCLFKDGIQPMWEDDRNRLGGRWLLNLTKNQRSIDLDKLWLETLLCLIGESFGDDSDEVCGAVVQIRGKGDKMAIWTRNADRQDAVMNIGRTFRQRLGLPPKVTLGYQLHMDTANKTGSSTKNRFSI